jgi:hypothetical protein
MRPWTQDIAMQQAWEAALGLDGSGAMPQGRDRTSVGCENNGDGPVAKGAARDQLRMEMPMLQQ